VSARVRVVRVGLLGYGRIGQAVAGLAVASRARLAAAGVAIEFAGALVRDPAKPRDGPRLPLVTDPAPLLAGSLDVVVEVLGGLEPARRLVGAALRRGVPVVTANKTLMAHCGAELRAIAAGSGAALALDAAVLAGVPFLGSLARRPLVADIRQIVGVINGTSHAIVGAIARGTSFDAAVLDAVRRGYAEPDSTADTSGRDAAEKLTILLHLSGHEDARVADIPCLPLERLQPADLAGARRMGGTIKPVALASLTDGHHGAWVGPAFVADGHPLAALGGVDNAVMLTDAHGHTLTFAGPGAGPEATAVTIVDDVVEATRDAGRRDRGAAIPPAALGARLSDPPHGPWFLRVDAASLDCGRIAQVLAARGVSVLHLAREADRVFARTAPGPWRTVVDAIAAVGARSVALPIVDESGFR
jgi:homoserine dehydrogenase